MTWRSPGRVSSAAHRPCPVDRARRGSRRHARIALGTRRAGLSWPTRASDRRPPGQALDVEACLRVVAFGPSSPVCVRAVRSDEPL